jgi:hypothetical protein
MRIAFRNIESQLGRRENPPSHKGQRHRGLVYHLVHDNAAIATHMLRRALVLHATPEARILWRLASVTSHRGTRDREEA